MKDLLERRFQLRRRKTTVGTEIIAGLTTFATLSYILAVQPSIMADAGMNPLGVFAATAIVSGLVTIAMGLFSNTPFALAPGMGDNILLAYVLVAGGICTWQQGLGFMFIAGAIFVLLSAFRVREKIAGYLPRSIKFGLSAALGIMLFQIGIANSEILLTGNNGWNDFSLPAVQLTFIGLAITLILSFLTIRIRGKSYKIRGAILISIVLTTLIGIPFGLVKFDFNINLGRTFSSLGDVAFKLDILGVLKPAFIGLIIITFIGDFSSTLGTALGAGNKAGLMDADGNMPMLGKIFLVDSVGTVFGTLMGCTVVTSYAESASGVEAGGRTGLTSVVTGLLFLVSLVLAPIFIAIPNAATAPALIIIGISMMQELRTLDFNLLDWTPVAMMVGFTAFGDLVIGITAGLVSDVVIRLSSFAFNSERKKGDLPSIPTIILAAIMCLQYII